MRRLPPALLAAALAACATVNPDPSGAAASLAAAETAFAAQSVREGLRAAFLAWLAPDAVLFRNGPVNGPASISARPDPPIVLDWRPAFVEVASSGDFGVSTGPWTITPRGDATAPPRHGQFFSVWTRPPGGEWRVRVDLGISHPGPALADAVLSAAVTPAFPGAAGEPVDAAEARFARLAARRATGPPTPLSPPQRSASTARVTRRTSGATPPWPRPPRAKGEPRGSSPRKAPAGPGTSRTRSAATARRARRRPGTMSASGGASPRAGGWPRT